MQCACVHGILVCMGAWHPSMHVQCTFMLGVLYSMQCCFGQHLCYTYVNFCCGSDVNARDTHGCTALHMMATNSGVHAKKMASLLLQAGANVGQSQTDTYTTYTFT